MAIRFTCPAGHRLEVPDEKAGRGMVCPVCQESVTVPETDGRGADVGQIQSRLSTESDGVNPDGHLRHDGTANTTVMPFPPPTTVGTDPSWGGRSSSHFRCLDADRTPLGGTGCRNSSVCHGFNRLRQSCCPRPRFRRGTPDSLGHRSDGVWRSGRLACSPFACWLRICAVQQS